MRKKSRRIQSSMNRRKLSFREYNRNRYAVDPKFAERLKAKRREVYQLKKETKESA